MATALQVIRWLRAAGEPTRLRLLALCRQRDLSVTDLADALGQSEPRVSRHLKILCEAELLNRLPQGQWVHYRIPAAGPAVAFLDGILAQLDRTDPLFGRDRERARSAGPARSSNPSGSRLGRALQAFVAAEQPAVRGSRALLLGVDRLELLEAASRLADESIAIARSRRAAQAARAFAGRRGLRCRVLAAPAGMSDPTAIAAADGPYDAVVLDHPALPDASLPALLRRARELLAPEGRLWLFDRYESLDGANERVVEHPLARLRRLLSEAGVAVRRLHPIEAEGEHVLAASAVPAASAADPAQRNTA